MNKIQFIVIIAYMKALIYAVLLVSNNAKFINANKELEQANDLLKKYLDSIGWVE